MARNEELLLRVQSSNELTYSPSHLSTTGAHTDSAVVKKKKKKKKKNNADDAAKSDDVFTIENVRSVDRPGGLQPDLTFDNVRFVNNASSVDSHGREMVNWISNAATELHMKQEIEQRLVDQMSNSCSDVTEEKPDYRKIAYEISRGPIKPKQRYCDFVLVHDLHSFDIYKINERSLFESALQSDGIELIRTESDTGPDAIVFVQLFATFRRLCKEAEKIFLNMDLDGCKIEESPSCCGRLFKSMKTDDQIDRISSPFSFSAREMFLGSDDERTFFRSAYRSMLVKNIMNNTTIRSEVPGRECVTGIDSLVHSNAYKSAFILHDRSEYDEEFPLKSSFPHYIDARKELHDTWIKCAKFQPLWKIRNYFGEKIALYFAWLGVLITSLWIPTILGIAVFIYGIVDFVPNNSFISLNSEHYKTLLAQVLDNDATPFFALIICLWGTVFLEVWKRKNAELAYKWDVDTFEDQEQDRPQYFGTEIVRDPLTGAYKPHYPLWRRVLKSMGSYGIILFMVAIVVISVVSVVVYKVVSRVDWFVELPAGSLAASLTASILNSISILILGRFYRWLAYKLTDWENHQTATQYEDSLIMKLFGFQFVNSYCSLFYIAFFRALTGEEHGMLDLGPNYTDTCENNDCMSELTVQVAVLMIMKPMPKLFSDIVLPSLKKCVAKWRCCNSSQIFVYDDRENMDEEVIAKHYLKSEFKKPPLGDFTLTEYTEKVLQYGFLMLFAAAFPLAPLIALITNLIDLRVDARRMLWFNRRPVPQRRQDIGMWFTILSFLNYSGMITNAFILGVTSRYGKRYQTRDVVVNSTIFQNATVLNTTLHNVTATPVIEKILSVSVSDNVWIILIFENVVLAVKVFLEYVIPDVPESVKRAKYEEKHLLERLLSETGYKTGPGMTIQKNKQKGKKDKVSSINVKQNLAIVNVT